MTEITHVYTDKELISMIADPGKRLKAVEIITGDPNSSTDMRYTQYFTTPVDPHSTYVLLRVEAAKGIPKKL